MSLDWKAAYAALQKTAETKFPPACLQYLLQVLRSAQPSESGPSLTPSALTLHFRRQSKQDFGPLLPMVLQDWGLLRPENFGQAMLLLGRQGCINLDPADTIESFSGEDPRSFLDA